METVINNPKWRLGRTTLKKSRRLGSVFACMAVIALVSGLPEGHTIPAKPPKVCFTPECIRAASNVMEKMKSDVDPCKNFYDFACGGFIEKTVLAKDDLADLLFLRLMANLKKQLNDIMKEERSEADPKYFEFTHALYKACMDINSIEKLGAKPIQQILKPLRWPVTDCDCRDFEKKWSLPEIAKKFRQEGLSFNYIFGISIDRDKKDKTKHIITLEQPTTCLDSKYLVHGFDNNMVMNYYNLLVSIAVLLGADIETAERDLRKSVQFEIDLAKISKASEDSDDDYNLFSIKELQELYPFIPWHKYINNIMPAGLTVEEGEIVNLSGRTFFEDLGKLLNRTNIHEITNYMIGAAYVYSAEFLSHEFRQLKWHYLPDMWNQQQQAARWKTCVNTVSERLSVSVGAQYVRRHLKESAKKIAFEMFTEIRNAFGEILDQIEWMDSDTLQEAKRKLLLMTANIGYPVQFMNNTSLEEYYRNFPKIDPAKFFKSIVRINVFASDLFFNKLRAPVQKNDWLASASPTTVNGYYTESSNSIELTAGIMQGQLFDSEQPQYINFAGIGNIVAHEITHAFDEKGREFNADGNFVDWWKPVTEKLYLEKVQCIIKQYDNYTDKQTGLNIDGERTMNENIADNGGLKGTYMAYQKWASNRDIEPQLPGLPYTPQQMLFISYAQKMCGKYRTDILKMVIAQSPHAPLEFRVLGPLQNMPEFSTDFGCLAGAPMNPVEKCKVWWN